MRMMIVSIHQGGYVNEMIYFRPLAKWFSHTKHSVNVSYYLYDSAQNYNNNYCYIVLHIIMVVLNISSYNSPEKSYIVTLWFACFSLACPASNHWLQVAA